MRGSAVIPGALLAAALVPASATLQAADSAVVLMYHRFGEDRYPATSVRVAQLEAHLEHLEKGGFTVVPLAAMVDALRGGGQLPERAVVLTVDDAYRSVYEVAFPRFKARRLPFTVFVSTDAIDGGLPDFMTWAQMREMAAHGATFANHGATHDSLIERRAGEDDATWRTRVRADVEKGRRRLEAELDPLPGVFSYPYGEYDTTVAAVVAALGYVAFGQQSGAVGPSSDPRAWPRFPMAEAFADLDGFRVKVTSLPLPVVTIDPWDPVTAERRPTLEVTLGPGNAALDRLTCYIGGQGRVPVEWRDPERRFTVRPERPLPVGRQRVNCTAPTPSGPFQWFSHQWVVRP